MHGKQKQLFNVRLKEISNILDNNAIVGRPKTQEARQSKSVHAHFPHTVNNTMLIITYIYITFIVLKWNIQGGNRKTITIFVHLWFVVVPA